MPKDTGERPRGTGKHIGCEGAMEEYNRRVIAAINNDRFLAALYHARMEEVDLADKIERELNGNLSNEERAEVIESEYRTPFEMAMAKVRAGAQISEIRPFSKAEPPYTLGGVGSRLL